MFLSVRQILGVAGPNSVKGEWLHSCHRFWVWLVLQLSLRWISMPTPSWEESKEDFEGKWKRKKLSLFCCPARAFPLSRKTLLQSQKAKHCCHKGCGQYLERWERCFYLSWWVFSAQAEKRSRTGRGCAMTLSKMFCSTLFGNIEGIQEQIHGILHIFQDIWFADRN